MALEPEVAPDETPDVLQQEGVKLTQCSKFTRELSAARVIAVQWGMFTILKHFTLPPPLYLPGPTLVIWEEHVFMSCKLPRKPGK